MALGRSGHLRAQRPYAATRPGEEAQEGRKAGRPAHPRHPDRQDFVTKSFIDKKLALDILNRAYRKILDTIESRFHEENISPSSGTFYEGTFEAKGLPCICGYAFRPAGGYVYLGIWPVDKESQAKPRLDHVDLSEVEKVRIIESIRDILRPKGEETRPWSPDTLDTISRVFETYHLIPPEAK